MTESDCVAGLDQISAKLKCLEPHKAGYVHGDSSKHVAMAILAEHHSVENHPGDGEPEEDEPEESEEDEGEEGDEDESADNAEESDIEEVRCAYCKASGGCPHLLLTVDCTFRSAENGPLCDDFQVCWAAIFDVECESAQFDESERFEDLLEEVDSLSDWDAESEFEGGPGMSSAYRSFYCSTPERVLLAVSRFQAAHPVVEDQSAEDVEDEGDEDDGSDR
jgi:hypothetical protein